ncbi:MAG: class I SAM-dependent methyltransferase, partial [Marmoricola sp.]
MSPEADPAGHRPEQTSDEQARSTHALSFAGVADTYDKARPSYPEDAAAWLVGPERARVLELGAGTGKLTELMVAAGHDVLATDPLPEMLVHLATRVPGARTAVASAERIPVPTQSVDVVVVAQAF